MDSNRSGGKGKPIRVLVVDDDDAIRRVVSTTLETAGCSVLAAADGREGLQLLVNEEFDVSVVDLRMDRMDGVAFLGEALKICPWLGVTLVTGYPDDHDVELARGLGVQSVLAKPFEPADLLREVRSQAQKKHDRLAGFRSISLDEVQFQLSTLRKLAVSALQSATLLEALEGLGTGLEMGESMALGILSMEEEPFLLLNARQAVSTRFLSDFEKAIRQRYRDLSGLMLPERVRLKIEGSVADESPLKFKNILSVPIITSGEVRGLLALAETENEPHTETETVFLYHAANLLSTVFLSFRRLRTLAVHDPLTGLHNPRGFREQLARIWTLARRHEYPVGVALIDVDHFKQVNDTYGHQIGDEVLRQISDLIASELRTSDIVGRYGGDEIILALPNAERRDALVVMERLVEKVRSTLFQETHRALRVTISIGVTASVEADGTFLTSDEAVAQADKALYEAKRNGRDRVCMWIGDGQFETSAVSPNSTRVPEAPVEKRPESRGRVAVVEDEPAVSDCMRSMLEVEGYDVLSLGTADAMLAHVRQHPGDCDVLLTDLHLDKDSGLDLLREVHSLDDQLVAVVMTGHATLDNAVESLRHGAYDFVQKPIRLAQLSAVIGRAVEYRRLKQEHRRYQFYLEEMVREKSRDLCKALEMVKHSYAFTLEAMAALLEAREGGTGGHSVRVKDYALVMGLEMGLPENMLDDLRRGALLHDIGKIAIPDSILLKQGSLTPEEWAVMRTHPEVGYRILHGSQFLEKAAEIVLQHQERFDGTGYPHKLRGEDICAPARIFAVVDAYDAMTSNRPYRRAMSKEAAAEEIVKNRGTHFDPVVVEAFLRCMARLG